VSTPVLHLLAGPNGSGKSTFVDDVLAPRLHLASAERARLLARKTSFISETVFSHPSKVDLVRDASAAGYYVRLHVILVPLDTTIRRVASRVAHGGHDVPEERIRDRYLRLWSLIARAIVLSDATTVYDNSLARRPFRRVAHFEHGAAVGSPQWPTWTPAPLRDLAGG
jgi:predicted ABC-type ATPase